MIFDVIQTKSGLSSELRLVKDNQVLSVSYARNNITAGAGYEVYKGDDLVYHVVYDISGRLGSVLKANNERMMIPYKILDRFNEARGRIFQRMSNGFFLFRYSFFELVFSDSKYNMYPVGMGKEGMKFPIYRNGLQVALIEKGNTVRNNLDQYSIIVQSEHDLEAVWLLCSYLDMVMYANRGEVVKTSVKKSYTITTNKELKSKYDPEFKRQYL